MTGERKGTGDILSTLTVAVLFLVILLLVVFSASSYKQATDIQNGNNNRRALLSYVTSCVRENSGSDIEIKDFGGVKGLAISADNDDFERRIYMKDGKLMEEYTEAANEIDPEEALVIAETDVFEVNEVKGGILEIKTDAGSSYVRIGKK